MTVQELSVLHRRYADLSHRFRAAWTFHQFLQSLEKSVLQRASRDYSTDFQTLYNELKEVSQSLNASENDRLRTKLDWLDRRLEELIAALEAEDSKVAPYFLRQFFRRVKNYDEKILTQLAKFYVYVQEGREWAPDRLDKVDFLLTRLSEEENEGGVPVVRDSRRLLEIFQGLWALLGEPAPDPATRMARLREIEAVRTEVNLVESLDQLNESGLVRRYRDLKHELGPLFFEPGLALAVQEANLALKARIAKLYRQEERRIVSEYQRVFELEREVPFDGELDSELVEFRQEIERFEKQLQRDELRLDDLAQIRLRVRSLLPRLTAAHGAGRTGNTGSIRLGGADTAEYAAAALVHARGAHDDLLGEHFRRVEAALRETNPEMRPESVVLIPEIFPLRLEPREVVAYRRLFRPTECDRELEQFLLEAAALRVRINEEAQEITGILDETSATGDAPVYGRARQTVRLADSYVWRFHHVLEETLLSGDGDHAEGRQINLLRMRLMRDYSGLWLLAYKPFLGRRPGGTLA